MKTTGLLMDIKHFAVHDGPGIRTTFFLKGCPLRCLWCHNPEGYTCSPTLAYYEHLCISCGSCAAVCPTGAHRMGESGHSFDRSRCIACGACAAACPEKALSLFGIRMEPTELLKIAGEDSVFYRSSGGGITLSGGEPLLQADFCAEALKLAKGREIHTAVDTCGAVPRAAFEKVLPYTDIFLFDIKHTDSAAHRRLTGLGNEQILSNLHFLAEQKKRVEIRIPLIPGCNDSPDNIRQIGRLLQPMDNISRVKILPYHDLARSKFAAVGLPDTMPRVCPPPDEALDHAAAVLCACGIPAVSGRKA